jgi:NitT/TauT family transport system permease protein
MTQAPTSAVAAPDPAADPAGSRSRAPGTWVGRAARVAGPPLVVAAAFIGLWYLVANALIPTESRFVLPEPHVVVDRAVLDWDRLSEILDNLWATTWVTVVGLSISIALGIALAVVMNQASWIERTLFPYAVALQTVPVIAVTPLIGLWWGFEFRSRVIVTILISIFPIIANTLFGLKSVEPTMRDLFRLHGAGRVTRLVKLDLPAAVPAMFTGFRIAAGLAVVGAVVGEFFFQAGDAKGIGVLINQSSASRGQGPQIYASIFAASTLGVALFALFGLVGDRLTRHWSSTGRA